MTKKIQKTNKNKKHNTTRVGHHYAQTNTNNVNKTCLSIISSLQTTGGKTNRTSYFCRNRNGHYNTELRT